MGWSDWPAWVKGGVIFSGIYIIFILAIFTEIIHYDPFEWVLFPSYMLLDLFIIPLPFSFLMDSIDGLILYFIINMILSGIFYFLIGALIGFIVGKIKSSGEGK